MYNYITILCAQFVDNMSKYNGISVDDDFELDFIEGEEHLPKYAVWSGDEESDIILKIYNNTLDMLPEKLQKQVKKISETNRNGQLLEILMKLRCCNLTMPGRVL